MQEAKAGFWGMLYKCPVDPEGLHSNQNDFKCWSIPPKPKQLFGFSNFLVLGNKCLTVHLSHVLFSIWMPSVLSGHFYYYEWMLYCYILTLHYQHSFMLFLVVSHQGCLCLLIVIWTLFKYTAWNPDLYVCCSW